MGALLAQLRGALPERALALDTSVIFGGFGLQLLTQIGWLVLALRFLGPEGYGLFAALTAVTVAVGCFVGWGTDQLLIRHAAASPETLGRWIGHGLRAILLNGLPALALLLLLLPAFEVGRIGTGALLAVLAADLLLGRWANLTIAVYMATGQSARQSFVTVVPGLLRLLAILLAGLLPGGLTMAEWAWWYAGATALSTVICLGLVRRDHGMPSFAGAPWEWGEGLAFSAEGALQAAVKDLDKPIVLELLGPAAAGLYAAAFRIVDVVALPIRAMGYALYRRILRAAAESHGAARAMARRMLVPAAGLGAAGGVGLMVFAGLLPWAFGASYGELPWIVRFLAPLPALFGAFVIGADLLTAVGRQSHRLAAVAVSLALTLALCWAGALAAGLEGAALARLAVQALTAALVWALATRGGRA